jgi:queuine tRNA-ribosyltransferase
VIKFKIEKIDPDSRARAGLLFSSHGIVKTPVFMPVGTQGTVKTVSPREIKETGVQIILSNTYHLFLRPGDDLIKKAGGLHEFTGWQYPILTDSGGYQVFSLTDLANVTDDGVDFQSHIDGSKHMFTPERVVDIQRNLGSDIMMVLDQCSPYPCTYESALKANNRTMNWADLCKKQYIKTSDPSVNFQSLFGIVQGSTYEHIRRISAEYIVDLGFNGYAIGGLAVGEPRSALLEITELCTELLPVDFPRYLMGIGKPEDIIEAIGLGVDMFDCVIPTRNGRNGTLYTNKGKLLVKNRSFESDFKPVDEECQCYTCTNFSRAYLKHLFHAGEILGMKLATIHNLHFYMDLVRKARNAILNGQFNEWKNIFLNEYTNNKGGSSE